MKATALLFPTLILVILTAPPESSAVILYGEGNDANQSDPGTGAPWDHVAHIGNLTSPGVGSSAVYLGWGYMITADHVAEPSTVSFDGVTHWNIASGSWQQVTEDVDLKLFSLEEDPGLPGLLLYEDAEESGDLDEAATIVGWGVGRDPEESEPGDDIVPWGDNTTREKRWGINTTADSATVPNFEEYETESLVTFLDNDAGDNQAAVTLHDSGGAMFQFIDENWYLSGIAIGVSQDGQSQFASAPDPSPGPPEPDNRDENYYARIAEYSDDINAVIPEPSAWALWAGLGCFGAVAFFRRWKTG